MRFCACRYLLCELGPRPVDMAHFLTMTFPPYPGIPNDKYLRYFAASCATSTSVLVSSAVRPG